jgi:hypothetical protein
MKTKSKKIELLKEMGFVQSIQIEYMFKHKLLDDKYYNFSALSIPRVIKYLTTKYYEKGFLEAQKNIRRSLGIDY